uniref:BTB and MATH domain-containing protein 42 n=2 Tax=Ascaris TaxID=6251 RepID=F1L222_ASCSU
MSSRMSISGSISALRTPSARPEDSASPQPRRLEVVSKQATKVTAISTRLEWKIDQFEKLMKLFKNGHNLISKQFGCPQAPTVTWELHVYPNGKREEDAGNVSFFLRQVGLQRGEEPIMTEFQIYALDANSLRVSVCRDTKDFTNQQGRGKFQVSREKMMAALKPDGALLLICEVEYFPPGSKISVEQAVEPEPSEDFEDKSELSIRDSLKEMLDNELFADCCIKVGNKTLRAHRCILGQHSEVFRSMFAQECMVEAQKGVIDIQDCRFEPVRAMIDYIYTGSTELVEGYAEDVLAIADKYAILPLKEQCERYLATTINSKNVASTAVFADTYSASILKQACTRYMMQHHRDVLRSAEWKQMKRERSELANDLLESVLAGEGSSSSLSDCSVCGSDDSAIAGSSSSMHDSRPILRKRLRRTLR